MIVQQSKDKDTSLLQLDWLDFVHGKLGAEQWLTVFRLHDNQDEQVAFLSVLVPNSQVSQVMDEPSWNWDIDFGKPGCIQHGGTDPRIAYYRFGNDEGMEPLILHCDFHSLKPSYLEVAEEFRLFHNLYFDSRGNKLVKVRDDGNEEDVAIFEQDSVRIQLKHIKQFLAMKDMQLVVCFDIRRQSTKELANLGIENRDEIFKKDTLTYDMAFGEAPFSDDRRAFSRLLGKKVIPGYAKARSGTWPYEEEPQYADFIIGTNTGGEEVTYTSDPDQLANHFGAHPDAPDYLTPVFFRRDVLTKYFANPDKFAVEDGYLRCGGLWGLHLDNNHPEYIIVYLGDLGRDLPYNEQLYWKTYNVIPQGGMSNVSLQRNIFAEFADPEMPDLLFKQRFELFQDKWKRRFSWTLFLPLKKDDDHYYSALRIPMTTAQAEFDAQVLALVKILIDSLNEEKIGQILESRQADQKGISKLEAFFKSRGMTDYQRHIKFLRDLYELRSSGVSHRKGQSYQRAAGVFHIGEKDLIQVFKDILNQSISFLDYLESQFALGSTK